jgi:hypothetical protein
MLNLEKINQYYYIITMSDLEKVFPRDPKVSRKLDIYHIIAR